LKIEPPEIVAVVSKIRLFEGEKATVVTLRPENIIPVEREVRDYWVVETAKCTLDRIENMKRGGEELVELAWQVYNPDLDFYEEKVRQKKKRKEKKVRLLEKSTKKSQRS